MTAGRCPRLYATRCRRPGPTRCPPAASDAFDPSSEASHDGYRRFRPCAPHPRPAPSGPGCGPWSVVPDPSPIGLTAAGLFAGGEVSRAGSRVRSPGIFTCARCPAVTSALDAVAEAYHNPAAVWWGAFAAYRPSRSSRRPAPWRTASAPMSCSQRSSGHSMSWSSAVSRFIGGASWLPAIGAAAAGSFRGGGPPGAGPMTPAPDRGPVTASIVAGQVVHGTGRRSWLPGLSANRTGSHSPG